MALFFQLPFHLTSKQKKRRLDWLLALFAASVEPVELESVALDGCSSDWSSTDAAATGSAASTTASSTEVATVLEASAEPALGSDLQRSDSAVTVAGTAEELADSQPLGCWPAWHFPGSQGLAYLQTFDSGKFLGARGRQLVATVKSSDQMLIQGTEKSIHDDKLAKIRLNFDCKEGFNLTVPIYNTKLKSLWLR